MASLDPTLLTAAIAAISGLGGALIPVISARIRAKPDSQTALNASFQALVKEYKDDRDKMETKLSSMEAKVFLLSEHVDALRLMLQHEGIEPPPRPMFNGTHI